MSENQSNKGKNDGKQAPKPISQWNDEDFKQEFGEEMFKESVSEINHRVMLLNDEISYFRNEQARMKNDMVSMGDKIKGNQKRIQTHCSLPYLVGNVVEILDLKEEDKEMKGKQDGSAMQIDVDKSKSVVVKTSTRQTIFLPVPGLVDVKSIRPGDLVGLNKDSNLILEALPVEFDSRVKAMEIDEKPTEKYEDIGGLEKQIEELVEAVVWPMKHPERFRKVGINPPKGVLLYGEPGTGKTLLARACAANTNACFLKLAGPQLVQMYIGDGAKLIRDAFALAKEKQPAIIFIDELDAVGMRRFSSEKSGDREVQRTMLELLNQMDGFEQNDMIKVIAATNRIDILDPALLRSGRLDRKVEFPLPDEHARVQVLKIHSSKMNVDSEVSLEELARCTEDFNCAQLKAVCVEAGMIALRRDATVIHHEDFMEGISQVKAKKKANINYFL